MIMPFLLKEYKQMDRLNNILENNTDLPKITQIINKHKETPGGLIDILLQIQDLYGYLPKEAIFTISEELHINVSVIVDIIRFDSQFRLKLS